MIFYEFHLVLLGFTGFKWVYWVLGNLLSMNGLLVFGFFLFQNDRVSLVCLFFLWAFQGRAARRSDARDAPTTTTTPPATTTTTPRPCPPRNGKRSAFPKKTEKKKKKRFPLILYLIGFFIYFFKFLPGLPSLFCFFLWCYGSDFTVYFEFH